MHACRLADALPLGPFILRPALLLVFSLVASAAAAAQNANASLDCNSLGFTATPFEILVPLDP
jgi:hypothetical protein